MLCHSATTARRPLTLTILCVGAGFLTFLYFHLITSKFIYFQREARCSLHNLLAVTLLKRISFRCRLETPSPPSFSSFSVNLVLKPLSSSLHSFTKHSASTSSSTQNHQNPASHTLSQLADTNQWRKLNFCTTTLALTVVQLIFPPPTRPGYEAK